MAGEAEGARLERGWEELVRMAGPERAAAVRAEWHRLSPGFEGFVLEVLAGEVWTRPGLDRKTRSLITIAALTALGRPRGLELNVEMALGNGATPAEIREAILHLAFYAGFPAAWEALQAAEGVLRRKST